MVLGILSDTHGFFHPEIPTFLKGVDVILHAGDVGDVQILDRLAEIAPVKAVWGNIDGQAVRQRTEEHVWMEVEGCRIWMTHIGGRPGKWTKPVGERLRRNPPHLLIAGHSHILQIERVAALNGMLFVNPGAAGKQGWHQEKTMVRLRAEGGKFTQAEVIRLDA